MIALLCVFLYLVAGIITTILLVKYAGYVPNEDRNPPALFIIAVWPIVIVIGLICSAEGILNKFIFSHLKKDNDQHGSD